MRKLLETAPLFPAVTDRRALPRTCVPIAKTITSVLELADKPMSVKDIHAACEQRLDREVLYGSIKDWLSDNYRSGEVERVALAQYQLNHAQL